MLSLNKVVASLIEEKFQKDFSHFLIKTIENSLYSVSVRIRTAQQLKSLKKLIDDLKRLKIIKKSEIEIDIDFEQFLKIKSSILKDLSFFHDLEVFFLLQKNIKDIDQKQFRKFEDQINKLSEIDFRKKIFQLIYRFARSRAEEDELFRKFSKKFIEENYSLISRIVEADFPSSSIRDFDFYLSLIRKDWLNFSRKTLKVQDALELYRLLNKRFNLFLKETSSIRDRFVEIIDKFSKDLKLEKTDNSIEVKIKKVDENEIEFSKLLPLISDRESERLRIISSKKLMIAVQGSSVESVREIIDLKNSKNIRFSIIVNNFRELMLLKKLLRNSYLVENSEVVFRFRPSIELKKVKNFFKYLKADKKNSKRNYRIDRQIVLRDFLLVVEKLSSSLEEEYLAKIEKFLFLELKKKFENDPQRLLSDLEMIEKNFDQHYTLMKSKNLFHLLAKELNLDLEKDENDFVDLRKIHFRNDIDSKTETKERLSDIIRFLQKIKQSSASKDAEEKINLLIDRIKENFQVLSSKNLSSSIDKKLLKTIENEIQDLCFVVDFFLAFELFLLSRKFLTFEKSFEDSLKKIALFSFSISNSTHKEKLKKIFERQKAEAIDFFSDEIEKIFDQSFLIESFKGKKSIVSNKKKLV